MGILPKMGTSRRFHNLQINDVLKLLRALEPDLNLPLALTLLSIAREPGLSIGELAARNNVPQQTASRYVAVLQGRYENSGDVGSFSRNPLVSIEINQNDPRKRAVYLTEDGTKRVKVILDGEGANDAETSPSDST
jgi:DNA-binding MarR family transcriptional regulator